MTRAPTKFRSFVDTSLELLRDNRLPPIFECFLSWIICVACLLYYGYCYCTQNCLINPDATKIPIMVEKKGTSIHVQELSHSLENKILTLETKEKMLEAIRSDINLRKEVSMFLSQSDEHESKLYKLLSSLRLSIMVAPLDEGLSYPFDLSLILPAYKELPSDLYRTLKHAYDSCQQPSRVQVIVIDAGHCGNLDEILATSDMVWGSFAVMKYHTGGGRGPTLNFGAQNSKGRILTFLHSDTLLPLDWDAKVLNAFDCKPTSTKERKAVHACCFSFGLNLTKEGLGDMAYPWGINSVRLLGNLRSRWFKLPYGDHVISMKASLFNYLGGYPDQPIMEDYELMDVLRKRALVLPERLSIIPPPAARCGVRRWQKFGVPYVTLVNALIVSRYIRGWTPDEIFLYYYQLKPQSKND